MDDETRARRDRWTTFLLGDGTVSPDELLASICTCCSRSRRSASSPMHDGVGRATCRAAVGQIVATLRTLCD